MSEVRPLLPPEFMPSDKVVIGKEYYRLDRCEKCNQETCHLFVFRSLVPRFVVYQCQACKGDHALPSR